MFKLYTIKESTNIKSKARFQLALNAISKLIFPLEHSKLFLLSKFSSIFSMKKKFRFGTLGLISA